MSNPFDISVIISTYDDRDLIPKKLAEIQAQTHFEKSEFIFIEPASPGKERELLEPFCKEHPNCRLIALEERINLYQAWNLGWSEARAPFVCISNMDDSMHPKLLATVRQVMAQRDLDVVTTLVARQEGQVPSVELWRTERLAKLKMVTRPGSFFAWRRDLDESFGKFDERFQIVGDKDFWARTAYKKLKTGVVPKVLYLHIHHDEQLSKVGFARDIKKRERAMCLENPYPHKWPWKYQTVARYYRLFRAIPMIGKSIYSD